MTGEMRFSSVPIFNSSLQVILFFWMLSTVTFFCLFVLHERAHSLSPSQVYHFPLLSLNSSYSNGMSSEFPPFTGLGRGLEWMPQDGRSRRPCTPGCFHGSHTRLITSAENTRVHNPLSNPRTSDSFSQIWHRPQGALSQSLCAY